MRAALADAPWPEIVQQSLKTVLAGSGADRAAVWMHSPGEPAGGAFTFHGAVAERSGDTVPGEWNTLAPEAPLLRGLLAGATQEQQFDTTAITIGVCLGMREGVWAPVRTENELRAIVFAAARGKKASLDTGAVETVAAELALILRFDDERKRARDLQQGISAMRALLAQWNAAESPDTILSRLVLSCTAPAPNLQPDAVFAAIGELVERRASRGFSPEDQSSAPVGEDAGERRVNFLWCSGDETLVRAMQVEPNAAIWRHALEHETITVEPTVAGAFDGVKRIVALPLHAAGQILGVLVAGLAPGHVSLATLERLELRAAMASQALLRRHEGRYLQRQRALTQLLARTADQPVVILEDQGGIAALSHVAENFLASSHLAGSRKTAASPVSRNIRELFHPLEHEQLTRWLKQQALASESSSAVPPPFLATLATGTSMQLRTVGAQNGYAAVLLEPLQGRQHKTPPSRAEDELFHVLEWLDEGLVLFDAQNEIRAMNTRFAQMTGLSPEQGLAVRSLNGLIAQLGPHVADAESFAAQWRVIANGAGSGVRDEVQLLRPSPRVLERVSRPVLDGRGNRLGRLELYRDLTAQRVFHSKLIRTEKLAALGQMLTSIAHELSNPLTSILGYAQRLLARNGTSEHAGEMRQIVHEAERAGNIVKQLLLTGRDARSERRSLALNDVIKRTMELQRFTLAAEKIHLELDLDPALPRIHGDTGQLQQVLMNLLGNSRQALAQRGMGGHIRITTARSGNLGATLEIADDGPGIPEAILARIFDPFFTTKPAGMGTGLGLSIVLGIVREHGGQVRASSAPGGGATFTIELPAAPAHLRAEEEAPPRVAAERLEQHVDAPESSLAPWRGSLVLVVEDEATVAHLIADVLEDVGLAVDMLLDGHEALSQVASQEYDLILCDMKMPGLDGEQFFRALSRAHPAAAERVLFVTGDVLSARTREFLQRHGLPHLAKPFRVEELTEVVRRALAHTSPREPRPAKTRVARN